MLVGEEEFPELRSWEKVGYLEPRGWAQPGTQAAGLQAWLPLRCWLASPWGLTPGLGSAPFVYLRAGLPCQSLQRKPLAGPCSLLLAVTLMQGAGLNCLRNPRWALCGREEVRRSFRVWYHV